MIAAGSFTDKKERFSPIRHLDFTMQACELKLVKICLEMLTHDIIQSNN